MMCAGALRWARPEAIIFGAADLKYGFDSTAKVPVRNANSRGVLNGNVENC